jgi:hypothetical protein
VIVGAIGVVASLDEPDRALRLLHAAPGFELMDVVQTRSQRVQERLDQTPAPTMRSDCGSLPTSAIPRCWLVSGCLIAKFQIAPLGRFTMVLRLATRCRASQHNWSASGYPVGIGDGHSSYGTVQASSLIQSSRRVPRCPNSVEKLWTTSTKVLRQRSHH